MIEKDKDLLGKWIKQLVDVPSFQLPREVTLANLDCPPGLVATTEGTIEFFSTDGANGVNRAHIRLSQSPSDLRVTVEAGYKITDRETSKYKDKDGDEFLSELRERASFTFKVETCVVTVTFVRRRPQDACRRAQENLNRVHDEVKKEPGRLKQELSEWQGVNMTTSAQLKDKAGTSVGGSPKTNETPPQKKDSRPDKDPFENLSQ
jgi:hypothetical protein